MPSSDSILTVVAKKDALGVGRSAPEEPLSLILSPELVASLWRACSVARARTLGWMPGAGSDSVKGFVEVMHSVLAAYEKLAGTDALTLRQTETLQETIAELDRFAAELERDLGGSE